MKKIKSSFYLSLAVAIFISTCAFAQSSRDEDRGLATDKNFNPAYLEKIEQSRQSQEGTPDFIGDATVPYRGSGDIDGSHPSAKQIQPN